MYILYGILTAIALLLFYMVFVEPRRLKKKHYFIRKNKMQVLDISNAYDLYEENTNMVIAHISDTHFSRLYKPYRLNSVIRSIMQTSPDLIIFTGDLIDNYKKWPSRDTKRLIEKLKKMSAPMGKIAILGNHDYSGDGQYFVSEVLKESGFTLLKNEEIFGANEHISINIAGVDDSLKGSPKFDFESTLAQWHLLLIHEPDSVQQIENLQNYDLILAGHSHGGQIRLPFVRYKHPGATVYKRGLYLFANKTLLSINNGLGMSIVPMRLGVPPEIIYYHLAKDEKIASKD